MTLSQVQRAIELEIQTSKADMAVLWQDISSGEVLFDFQGTKPMVSASTIKVHIMIAAVRGVFEGKWTLDQPIPVNEHEILPDSRVFEYGPCDMSLEELMTWMIIQSDNTATNVLIELLGMPYINDVCGEMGLTQTSLQRRMLDFAAIDAGRNNYISARDFARCLEVLRKGELLNVELASLGLSILARQRDKEGLPRYICADMLILHKTGGLDYLSHDAGDFIVPGGRSFHLGVYIQQAPDITGDDRRVGRIAQLAYDFAREQQKVEQGE